MSKNCDIIRDLLPLYAENMCSDQSRQTVAEHISQCADCKKELEKINTDIVIQADSDISMMKRIKKRTRIEKIVIAIVSLYVAFTIIWIAQFYLINTTCTMDVEKINLDKNVSVEVDDDGMVWLCTQNEASHYDYIYPVLADKNGKNIYDEGFDKDNVAGYGVTFEYVLFNKFAMLEFPGMEIRKPLFNINEKDIEYVFYYDRETDTEYKLWERD